MKKALIMSAAVVVIFASLLFYKCCIFQEPNSSRPSETENMIVKHMHSDGINEFAVIAKTKAFPENDYKAVNYERQIGVWISYIDLAQMMKDATEDQFRESIKGAYKNIVSLGGNTVYVHVRAFADAYYPSVMYPYTAAFGESEPYDALQIMIEEAHKLGLSFHAWVNPMRCGSEKSFEDMAELFEIKSFYTEHFGEYVNTAEGSKFLWLDPSNAQVRDYIAASASEIVSLYDVDGIHIDDYFYPTTSADFDKVSFEKSGADSLSDWRRSNITKLVLQMNMQIKNTNPTVVFEISPQGNIKNNYDQMYADVESWCSSSLICDNIIPQVYYGYNSSSPYLETINRWSEMTQGSKVKLIIGLGVYKIGEEKEFKTTSGIIAMQISDAMEISNVGGVAFYGYATLFSQDSELQEKMDSEREAIAEALKTEGSETIST